MEAPCSRFLLGCRREDRRDATASMLRSHGDVLQLRRVGQGQVRMPERLVMLPSHKVEAVPLVKAGEAENGRHGIKLVPGKRADYEGHGSRRDGRRDRRILKV